MSIDALTFGEEYYFNTDWLYHTTIMEILKERHLKLKRNRIWETQPEMNLFTMFKSRFGSKKYAKIPA